MNDSYNYSAGYENHAAVINHHAPVIAGIIGGVFFLLIIAALYVYFSYIIYRLAKKTNTEHAGWAWIPFVNLYLLIKIAQKPGWWLILFFIPIVNIIIAVLVWMSISRRVGKPDYLGLFMVIPILNLVIPAYLAFSEPDITTPTVATPTPPVPPTTEV